MLSLYTDGSSHAMGGKPGGWAWVLARGAQPLAAGTGGHSCTTNNIMELMAVREGLLYIMGLTPTQWEKIAKPGETIEIVADSQYALGIAAGTYTPSKNVELAKEVAGLAVAVGVTQFRWVPGHSGNPLNERCDSLAKEAKEQMLTPEQRAKLEAKKFKKKETKRGRKRAK